MILKSKPLRWLIYLIGTGFFSGYSPVAPGTAGSVVGLALLFIIPGFSGWKLLLGCILAFFIGVPAATQIERFEKKKDCGLIVIDEIVGMWITFLYIPGNIKLIGWIAGFLLFRLFDIIKPFPAHRSQNLKAGWGVMVDDVIAGVYANLVLQVLIYAGLFT
jgi:phosphatidylglycerophosphatase A